LVLSGRENEQHGVREWYVRVVVVAAVVGAFLGATAVVIAYVLHPTLTLEMDRSLPRRFASGLYDSERSDQTTFAWTAQRADIKLADLDRRTPWTCSVRFRGGRSDPATQPSVDLVADGIVAATAKATNVFQDATVVLPGRPARGAVLTIAASGTIVPGPADPRQLGIQIDRIACAPSGGVAFPPSSTVRDAALTGAILAAAFALAGLPLALTIAGVVVLMALQSLPLSAGPAPYTGFSATMVWFALWIGASTVAIVAALDRFGHATLQNSARIAIAISAAVLYLKLLGLLHPSKLLVDAVFHAHRFEWVMAGQYFFTQPMPSGVTFPYAVGLYVFAAPWSVFTHDHVTLLRVIVCSAQTIAGALLYPLIIKAWGDRTAALTAIVLFSLVPLPLGLLGNANLTNMFGESVALAAVLTASLLPAGGGVLPLVLYFLLSVLAFLSHVSTFAILGVTLVALAVLHRMFVVPARTAWVIGGVAIVSAVLAVVLYYGHFGDVYKNALRVRTTTAASQPQVETPPSPTAAPAQNVGLGTRIANTVRFAVGMIGWPIVLLALVGVWRSVMDARCDRATLAVMAWATACLAFVGVAVMRVDAPFQRYAAEFFGRVLLATFPAAVLLAARGAAWSWNRGLVTRLGSAVLLACAVALGLQSWMAWFL